MKQDMPDIRYERSMNHNYMILSRCDFFGRESGKSSDYRTRMLLENHIPGLLPVTHRLINGESRYYYEINSLQSLDRLYDKSEIGYDELKSLLSGCVRLFDRLEEYLLDGAQIIIKPAFIYVNVEKMEPFFVCYPDYEGDVRLSFMEFIDELLTKIDHTDERAVMLGYQVYRYTRNPNYVICEISHMMSHTIVEMAGGDAVQRIADEDARTAEPENMENADCFSPHVYDDGFDADDCDGEVETSGIKPRKTKDLLGAAICLLISLCAGAVIAGARIFGAYRLSADNELYLYGAITMSVMAAVLFLSCYGKKRKQDKMIEGLGGESEDCGAYTAPRLTEAEDTGRNDFGRAVHEKRHDKNILTPTYDETVCLGNGIVEERMLYGRINGREVSVSLDKLPMTVGKLANVSDFVINDTAVSKMHARFEERGGRVYVCDLNSTNGTVRNGILLGVNQSVALEPGDKLRFGRTSFTYC